MSPSLSDAPGRAIAVHEATRQDRHHLKDVLARSFWDDPVISWLLPDDGTRYARSTLFFRADLAFTSRQGTVLTTEDQAGAALWLPPKRWKMPNGEMARNSLTFLRAFRTRIPVSFRFQELMEKVHPKEPHWYLAVLGTDPIRQGRGVGAALIRDITDKADAAGDGCYLESSKDVNVPYYERFGFKVTEEFGLPGGPTLWAMWRDPQEPRSPQR